MKEAAESAQGGATGERENESGPCRPSRRGAFPWWRTLAAFVLGMACLAFLHTEGQFIRKAYLAVLLWGAAPVILAGMIWRLKGCPRAVRLGRLAPELVLFGAMLLYLVSSATRHRWFYFLRWTPCVESLFSSNLLLFTLGSVLLLPLFLTRVRRVWVLVLIILVASQIGSLRALIRATGGEALYRTDHPSFMFRLWEVAQCFPQFVNYNPYWNGGTLHCVGVTSGAQAPGLLLWPLLRLWPVHEVYTWGVGLLFIGVVPWVAVASVRAMGGDRAAACVGGVLALRVSQQFFLWMLHYGTIGAALSSSMILPLAALSFRTVMLGRFSLRSGVALVAAAFFFVLWPLDAFFGMSIALALVVNARYWTVRKLGFLAACGAVLLVLCARTLLTLLHEGGNAVDFVLQPAGAEAGAFAWLSGATLAAGWRHFIDHVREGQPILIFFGLAGCWVMRPKRLRYWYLPILLGLFVVTGWGAQWKPHSQLSRASIPLFFVCVAPAAIGVSRLLRCPDMRLAAVRACLVSLLAVTGYNAATVYGNESLAPYVVMNDETRSLADWIRANVPEGGRLLFAGKCVHAYGRGNVAYLPVLTGREMMADDYYGFPPGMIEYEYPPKPFRKSLDMMKRFFDAYNVTHVVSYHEKWHRYFESHPDTFEETFAVPSFDYMIRVYKVKRASAPLVRGAGSVHARFNRIRVELADDAAEAVLAYNWIEGLTAPDPVEVFPFEWTEGITLIGVRPHGRKAFDITYRKWF